MTLRVLQLSRRSMVRNLVTQLLAVLVLSAGFFLSNFDSHCTVRYHAVPSSTGYVGGKTKHSKIADRSLGRGVAWPSRSVRTNKESVRPAIGDSSSSDVADVDLDNSSSSSPTGQGNEDDPESGWTPAPRTSSSEDTDDGSVDSVRGTWVLLQQLLLL